MDKHLKEFIDTLMKIKSEKMMLDFLKGVLTPSELEEIPVRLKIVKMIKEGVSQREIAKRLGVGVATVTRGSRELKNGRFKILDKK